MNEILTINYESENPTVSARELHEKLHIGTKFTTWFERMKEYGFSEGKEFFPKLGETSEQGGRPQTDFEISVDMAKQICMIQRSPEGKQIRQYFIDLENAWNTPEQIFARALKMADKTIECWKIVRAAKKAELIYEKDKEAAEKQFRTEAAKHFEKAFGKGSCWKVFGTHYPSSTGYAEFINQITALIKKWNVVDQGNEILKDFHGYR